MTWVLSALLALAAMVVIIRLSHSWVMEVVFSTIFLGFVAAYHFYLQPNLGFLPEFPSGVQLFIGFFIFFRSLLMALQLLPQTAWVGHVIKGR